MGGIHVGEVEKVKGTLENNEDECYNILPKLIFFLNQCVKI